MARRALLFIPVALLFTGVPARAEELQYDVTLFGVPIGEIRAQVASGRLRLDAASAGALVLLFPLKETIDIRLQGGHPVEVVRRYDHAGDKGEWRARVRKRTLHISHRVPDGAVRKRKVKLPSAVYDPASALQRLRASAPAAEVTLPIFEGRKTHEVRFVRVSERPLRYRAVLAGKGPYKPRRLPSWLRLLGLGGRGTPRPEAQIWLSDDARRVPTKIRLSDPRGVVELTLRPAPAARGATQG